MLIHKNHSVHLFCNDFLSDSSANGSGRHRSPLDPFNLYHQHGTFMTPDLLLRVEAGLIMNFFPLGVGNSFKLLQIAGGDAAHR